MATQFWLGGAVAIPEVKYLAWSGVWATGDSSYIEINGKRLTLTVGTTATTSQIVQDMMDMINGDAANDDETRSALGSTVGEFAKLTATSDTTNSYVILTGQSDGQPIGSLSTGTDGSGTIGVPAGLDITGTGPNYFDDVDNWSQGTVPADADDIVFDSHAAASLLYNLSQTAITPASITAAETFRHSVGLPEVNKDSPSYPYDEPRPTYLALGVSADATTIDVQIDGSGGGIIKLDTNTSAATVLITGSGTATENGVPPVLWKGNSSSNTLTVSGGDVGAWFEPFTTGTAGTIAVGSSSQRPSLRIGNSVTLSSTTLTMSSGTVECGSSISIVTMSGGEYTQSDGTIGTIDVYGATFYPESDGTITTLRINSGGVVDCGSNGRSRTITNAAMYGSCSLMDPLGTVTFTNGIDVYGKLADVTLDLPPRKTYSLSAI